MTTKEKFLSMKTWEEFLECRKREGMDDLDLTDKDVQKHIREIQPRISPPFGPHGEIEYLRKAEDDGEEE